MCVSLRACVLVGLLLLAESSRVVGETTAKETTVGESASKETTVGETTDKETNVGEKTAGETTAGEETAGEKLVSTIDKSLSGIQKNLYKGMTAMGTPAVKFTVDTLPHLVHIYALVQGVRMPAKLVSFTKDAVGRLALVAGTAASDTLVLGSSVLADVTTITASVLEVQNDILNKAGHKGIYLAGDMVESLVDVTSVGVDAAAVGLTALGDTLLSAAKVNNAMSGASARLITAIGTRLVGALDGVRKHSNLLTSKLLSKIAREEHATNLLSYISTLKNTQKVLEDLVNQDSLENTTNKT